MKKLLLPILLILLLPFVFNAQAATDPAWQATYWDGIHLDAEGVATVHRQDPYLNFDWGRGRPAPNIGDNFAARWTRTVDFQAGTYIFTASADDRVRVWVDNVLLLSLIHI